MTSRRALWALIVVSGALRLAWSATLGLGNDEAYHYLFTLHPDWSYFDHPPMLAVVERLGIALNGGQISAFSLRLGFVVLFAGSTWLMARLTSRYYGENAGFLAAFALNVSAYFTAAAATFALPDGPLLFFWLLTLDRLAVALESPGRTVPWVGVGLAWGGALLSKYHAIFLPAGAFLYFVFEPSARLWLRRAGPYLAVAIGLAIFSPVVAWNASHEWASFAFQGGRAVGSLRFRPDTAASAVLGAALYLFPWIWLTLLVILYQCLKRFYGGISARERFLVCQSVVPLSVFLAVACTRPVLPHWTLVAFLSLFPMLGQRWAAQPVIRARRLALLSMMPLVVAGVVLVQTRSGILQNGGEGTLGVLKVSRDPTVDLYGWDEVGRELRERGLLDRPDTFLFTSFWFHSGHVAFATRGSSTPVLCYNWMDARSFSFWSRPEDWLGKDGILLSINGHEAEPECYDKFFRRIELVTEFAVERAGAPVRKIRVFRCMRQIEPFPFDGRKGDDGGKASAVAAKPVDQTGRAR